MTYPDRIGMLAIQGLAGISGRMLKKARWRKYISPPRPASVSVLIPPYRVDMIHLSSWYIPRRLPVESKRCIDMTCDRCDNYINSITHHSHKISIEFAYKEAIYGKRR
jgi:hypothetical protein